MQSNTITYREKFGLENPSEGTTVKISYMEGCRHMITWPDCPDKENIIAMGFSTIKKAIDVCVEKGWKLEKQLF